MSSYQLHSTLALDEVLRIITEIVINLIGADVFAIYLIDGESRAAAGRVRGPGASRRSRRRSSARACSARRCASNESTCWDAQRSDDLSQPIVCVPLVVQNRPIGAIAVYGLLAQKDGFSALDHELFNMLGGHAATAIFAAKLYSQSERKLNTIQGFIDLLTK